VHEKFTKREGKDYGPYLYENKRVGDKVITSYVGKPKKGKIGIFSFLLILVVLAILGLWLFYNYTNVTGRVSLEFETAYKQGEPLDGKISFNIKEGELVPANSDVLIEYDGQTRSFKLSELVNDISVSGEFYTENTVISGSGDGYGIEGSKNIYPEIAFELKISNSNNNDVSNGSDGSDGSDGSEVVVDNNSGSETGTGSETVIDNSGNNVGETIGDVASDVVGVVNEVVDSAVPSSDSSAPAESASDSLSSSPSDSSSSEPSSDSSGITGAVIGENEFVVPGTAKKGNDFSYNLEDGQTAEIVSGSVNIDGREITNSALLLEIVDGKAVVSTNYFITERGYGSDFLGDYALTLNVDATKLGLVAVPTNLKVSLIYGDKTIVSKEKSVSVAAKANVSEEFVAELGTNVSLSLIKDIPIIRMVKNTEKVIDLSEYFANADRYEFSAPNIGGDISGNELILTPEADFKGATTGTITAYFGQDYLSVEFRILVSNGAVNVEVTRSDIKVGEEVRWVQNITLEAPEDVVVEIPIEAENIEVTKVDESGNAAPSSALTGFVTLDISVGKKVTLLGWLKGLFSGMTGNVIAEENISSSVIETQEVILNESVTSYTIEYTTPAPTATEEITSYGKEVVISAPDNLGYTDVLSFTDIPEVYSVGEEDKIRIYWVENNTDVPFDAYDLSGDGKLDYVEWVTPHLSNQTFEIILITKAQLLDENRNYISDVYDYVFEQDDIWVTIPDTHYIRATFEQNLTAGNDMTIYAKGTGTITVFNENGNDSIGEFTINGENTYKIYPDYDDSAVYDLLFSGNIEVDYIVDPSTPGNITGCMTIDTAGTYTLQNDITDDVGGNCFTITADNVVLDLNGKTVDGDDYQIEGDYGVYLNGRTNVTVKNGTITGLDYGIYLESSSNNNITGITTIVEYGGIRLANSNNNQLTDITASDTWGWGHGISLESSSNNTLTNITANENAQNGIYISSDSTGNSFNGVSSSNGQYDTYCDSTSPDNYDNGLTYTTNYQCSFAVIADITSCGTINQSGTYTLNQSISSSGTCLTISSNDVIIDGATHSLTYDSDNSGSEFGIYVTDGYSNITVMGFDGGISDSGTGNGDSAIGTSGTAGFESITIDGAVTGSVFYGGTYNVNGDINTGTIGGAFASGSTVTATNINITGTISNYFATSSTVTATGDITTGDISDSFAELSTVTATNINITGDINYFVYSSTVNAVNITTGYITVLASEYSTVNANNINIGNIAWSFAEYSTVTANNITTGYIDYVFASSSTVTATGDITTGDISDSFADSSSTVTATNINTGTVYYFAYYSTVNANNITTGNIGDAFALDGATINVNNINTGDITNFFASGSTVTANNINITGDINYFVYSSSTVTATGDITTGNIISSFAESSTITATGDITTGNIGDDFADGSSTVTATGDITTGDITNYFADGYYGSSTVNANNINTGHITTSFAYYSTVNANNINTGTIGNYFALWSSTITATGDITTGDITYDFARDSSTITATGDITTGNIGDDFARDSSTVNANNINTGTINSDFAESSATVTANNNVNVNGNIMIDGSSTFYAPTNTYLTGNWNNAGTFDARGGTVTFNGTDESIIGNTEFYNIVKVDDGDDSTDETLTFDNTGTITVNGTLTITGVNISASDETQLSSVWFYNGSANVSYSSPVSVVFSQGSNILSAWANDSLGNINTTSVIFYVDSIAPTASYLVGTANNGEIVMDSLRLNVSIDDGDRDDFANAKLYIDNAEVYSTNSISGLENYEYNISALGDGEHNYYVETSDIGNVNQTANRTFTKLSSCIDVNGCSLGNPDLTCNITQECVLNNNLCSGGVCEFGKLTINASIYTLYDENGNGNDLTINLTDETPGSSITFLSGNKVVFSGRNGSDLLGGSQGGNASIVNITVYDLFNTTAAMFEGVGGYSTLSGAVGGNGGQMQLNYHGLIQNFYGDFNGDFEYYDNLVNMVAGSGPAGSGESYNAGIEENAGDIPYPIMNKDLTCRPERDADIGNDGIVDANDYTVVKEIYGSRVDSEDYLSVADVACKNKTDVRAISRVGFNWCRGGEDCPVF